MPVRTRFQAGGTVRGDALYVERAADRELTDALRKGEYCYVLAPRQIGKSSLCVHAEKHLNALGVRCVNIDLTALGSSEVTQEEWYYGLVEEIGLRLHLDDERDPAEYWVANKGLSPVHRWSRYLRTEVLGQTTTPIVIFVDEIDVVLSLPFPRDDFFASIRACFNARAEDPAYERLTFCLLGVAAASDLIADPTRTPFNIGCDVYIEDFTADEMCAFLPGLADTYRSPQGLSDEVYRWTSGHPYMTQRLLKELTQGRGEAALQPREAVSAAVTSLFLGSGGQEDTNLAVAEKLFQRNPLKDQMLQVYRQLLAGIEIEVNLYNPIHMALRLTGMVSSRKAHGSRHLWVRNQIFARVFDQSWVHEQETERLLNTSLEQWLLSGREEDYVLRGKALQEAYAWSAHREDLTVDERAFLIAGLEVAQKDEEARQKVERERERRQEAEVRAALQQRAIRVLGGLVFALVGLVIFAFWQYRNARQANEKERVAKEQAVQAQKGEQRQKAKAERALSQAKRALDDVKRAQSKTQRALFLARQSRQTANEQKRRAVRLLVRVGASLRKEKRARLAALRARKRAETLRKQERAARHRAEQAERAAQEGSKAISLAAQAGQEMRALRAGILGAVPSLRSRQTPPLQALEGLIQAVNAARQTRGFRGHLDAVTRVRFLPKGQAIATASRDRTVRLWTLRSGRVFGVLQGHRAAILAMAQSPTSALLATADEDGTILMWDLAPCLTKQGRAKAGRCRVAPLRRLRPRSQAVHSLAFSPGGHWLASACLDRSVDLWEVAGAKRHRQLRGHQSGVMAVAFTRKGRLLASADREGEILLWTWRTGQLLRRWRAHSAPINALALSGEFLLSVSDDKTARLWDFSKGKQLHAWRGHSGRVTGGALSPGGVFAVTTSTDQIARLWSVRTGRRLRMLDAHTDAILDVAFAQHGLAILTASKDKTARLWWPFRDDATRVFRGHVGFVNAAIFARGKIVTASSDATLRIWEPHGQRNRLVVGHASWVGAVAFQDGKLVTASRDRTVRMWEMATGKLLNVFRWWAWQEAVAWAPGARFFASGGDDRVLHIADGRRRRFVKALKGHQASITSLAFSHNARWLVSGSQDRTVRLWDVRKAQLLRTLEGHQKSVTSVSFSPDSRRILSASLDRTARIWLRKDGKRISVFRGHRGKVMAATFSPDGSRIASASSDRTVRIWDAQTARPIATLRGHQGAVLSVQFSPDGRYILTGSMDGTARIFPASEHLYLRTGCRLLQHQREFAGVQKLCAAYLKPRQLPGHPSFLRGAALHK